MEVKRESTGAASEQQALRYAQRSTGKIALYENWQGI